MEFPSSLASLLKLMNERVANDEVTPTSWNRTAVYIYYHHSSSVGTSIFNPSLIHHTWGMWTMEALTPWNKKSDVLPHPWIAVVFFFFLSGTIRFASHWPSRALNIVMFRTFSGLYIHYSSIRTASCTRVNISPSSGLFKNPLIVGIARNSDLRLWSASVIFFWSMKWNDHKTGLFFPIHKKIFCKFDWSLHNRYFN
jgi:hypothetical protein